MIDRLMSSPYFQGRGLVVTISLVFVLLSSVGLDQASKHHVQRDLLFWEDPNNTDLFRGRKISVFSLGQKYSTDPSQPHNGPYFGFHWQYSRNKGAAFSMLATLDDGIRVPLFYGITMFAVILISFYLYATPMHHYLTRYGLILVLSGALGNFLDRLQHGYVIDFIDVDWNIFGWAHDFAIFNVADVCINIGVGCLLVDMLVQRKDEEKESA